MDTDDLYEARSDGYGTEQEQQEEEGADVCEDEEQVAGLEALQLCGKKPAAQ